MHAPLGPHGASMQGCGDWPSRDTLQRLNQEFKKTIIMVTHDPHAAERASHLLHLEKGTLVEQTALGSPT